MRWPWVHRSVAARLEMSLVRAEIRYDRLVEEMLRMKQQGFVAVPPKRAPKPDYTAEPETPDPFIEQQVREGVPEHLARQAQQEAIEAFESGDA